MARKGEVTTNDLADALVLMMGAISRLSEKVDSNNGFCEAVLDEVTPMAGAIDKLLAAAPCTKD